MVGCGVSFGFLQKTKTLKMASLSDGRDILKGFVRYCLLSLALS
jgi:hypothetical protein